MARRLGMMVGSVAAGWAALIALTYLAERPLLVLAAPLVGPHWAATAGLGLDCLKLAALGWAVGRLHRAAPLRAVLAFAVTLSAFNLQPWLPLDVPWLIRLATDAVHDARYVGPLATLAAEHALLFGSLIAGAMLSRPREPLASLFGEPPAEPRAARKEP